MSKLNIVLLCCMLALLGGCSTNLGDVTVNKWRGTLEINGEQFRRYGSSNAALGSYGRRLDTGKNAYQEDGLFINKFKIKKPVTLEFSRNNVLKLAELGFELAETAKAALELGSDAKEKYKLVIIRPQDPSVFERTLYEKGGKDDFLFNKMKNKWFRYIEAIVMISDHQQTSNFEAAFDAKTDLEIEKLPTEIKIGIGGAGGQELKLSDNQVIAYQYRRLCWESGKPVDSIRDQAGLDDCQNGHRNYPGNI